MLRRSLIVFLLATSAALPASAADQKVTVSMPGAPSSASAAIPDRWVKDDSFPVTGYRPADVKDGAVLMYMTLVPKTAYGQNYVLDSFINQDIEALKKDQPGGENGSFSAPETFGAAKIITIKTQVPGKQGSFPQLAYRAYIPAAEDKNVVGVVMLIISGPPKPQYDNYPADFKHVVAGFTFGEVAK